jgi:hypothetical protein
MSQADTASFGDWRASGAFCRIRRLSPKLPLDDFQECSQNRRHRYQILHAFSVAAIGSLAEHPKALANSGMFCTTPMTRNSPGE